MEDLEGVQHFARWGCTVAYAYVDDVFALVPFLIVGTRAGRQLADVNAVDVARSTSNVNCLLGSFFSSASGAIDNEHPLHPSLGIEANAVISDIQVPLRLSTM